MVFSKNIMSTSPFVFALLVFKTSYSSEGCLLLGYNYRNRPAMGDICIEKGSWLALDNIRNLSRGDYNENPNNTP
jgi:hypothetical protein